MPGMRVRLTQNLDKQRGFVNGAFGVIILVLRKDVFIMETPDGVRILVHPVWQKGQVFVPVTLAYATTIRRAQGATLDMAGLWFDRKRPDRGYAYVGASRTRRMEDVFHVGNIRRSDWLPVGCDPRGGEQIHPGPESNSDSEEDCDPADFDEIYDSETDGEAYDFECLSDADKDDLKHEVSAMETPAAMAAASNLFD